MFFFVVVSADEGCYMCARAVKNAANLFVECPFTQNAIPILINGGSSLSSVNDWI